MKNDTVMLSNADDTIMLNRMYSTDLKTQTSFSSLKL